MSNEQATINDQSAEANQKALEQLINIARRHVAGAKSQLEKFAAILVEHPESAVTRSGSTVFTATAEYVVWTEVLNDAEGGATLLSILSSLDGHIYYTALNPPHSSSQLDNYLGVEKNRVRAGAAAHIKRLCSVASSAIAAPKA